MTTRKKRKASAKDADEIVAQGRCPSGHALPYKTNAGRCTPLYCAGKVRSVKEKAAGAKGAPARGIVSTHENVEERLAAIEEKVALLKEKRKFFGIPEGLEGADAEEFIDKKLVALGVDAVAELEEQLKLGDRDDKRWAAGRVLDAIGRGKREVANAGGPVIMLIGASKDGRIEVPWAQRVEPAKIEEGKK